MMHIGNEAENTVEIVKIANIVNIIIYGDKFLFDEYIAKLHKLEGAPIYNKSVISLKARELIM